METFKAVLCSAGVGAVGGMSGHMAGMTVHRRSGRIRGGDLGGAGWFLIGLFCAAAGSVLGGIVGFLAAGVSSGAAAVVGTALAVFSASTAVTHVKN